MIFIQKGCRDTNIPNVRPVVGAAAPEREQQHNIRQGVWLQLKTWWLHRTSIHYLLVGLCHICVTLLEAGVLKENPVGFWPKRFPPSPRDGVVLAVEAGVAGAVPRAVPKEKPPVLAAGALRRKKTVNSLTRSHSNAKFSYSEVPITQLYLSHVIDTFISNICCSCAWKTDEFETIKNTVFTYFNRACLLPSDFLPYTAQLLNLPPKLEAISSSEIHLVDLNEICDIIGIWRRLSGQDTSTQWAELNFPRQVIIILFLSFATPTYSS